MTLTAINIVAKQHALADSDIVVGKDIMELLANAMYVDPLTIYREYIQNSADAIDEARRSRLPLYDPHISIALDHSSRTVRIRDNGESIANANFVKRITAIGASHKRGSDLRGFRGIGRLSGLGYCQELVFRGKAEGDLKVVEVTWNSRALRERIRDLGYKGSLIDIVRDVVSYSEVPAQGKAERFFEVEMRKVSRLRGDLLMNEQSIRSYLAQVAPVPFHESFSHGEHIQAFLAAHGIRPPIRIELNDDAGPIYHRARNTITFNPKTTDTVREVDFLEILDADGAISAFGWIANHSYMGSIPRRLGIGGIRLRAGNIQVGDEALLAPLYPEPRFASWAIGDIHVSSKHIIPNGRRDDFEHSIHYSRLQTELSTKAYEVAHQIRARSQQRQFIRNAHIHFKSIDEWLDLAKARKTPLLLRKALLELSAEQISKASKDVFRLPADGEEIVIARERLEAASDHIRQLSKKIERKDQEQHSKLSKATERALLQALKVVLSNARSAKVGNKTALDIVDAVTAIR